MFNSYSYEKLRPWKQEFLYIQQERWYLSFTTVPVLSGAQCDDLHVVFIQPELKCSLQKDKENQVPLSNQPEWLGVSGQSWDLWGWRMHTRWSRGCRKGETRAAAWWLWEMNADANTQPPPWSPTRDRVCFSLPDVFIEVKTFEK